jgi:hypothetical protein
LRRRRNPWGQSRSLLEGPRLKSAKSAGLNSIAGPAGRRGLAPLVGGSRTPTKSATHSCDSAGGFAAQIAPGRGDGQRASGEGFSGSDARRHHRKAPSPPVYGRPESRTQGVLADGRSRARSTSWRSGATRPRLGWGVDVGRGKKSRNASASPPVSGRAGTSGSRCAHLLANQRAVDVAGAGAGSWLREIAMPVTRRRARRPHARTAGVSPQCGQVEPALPAAGCRRRAGGRSQGGRRTLGPDRLGRDRTSAALPPPDRGAVVPPGRSSTSTVDPRRAARRATRGLGMSPRPVASPSQARAGAGRPTRSRLEPRAPRPGSTRRSPRRARAGSRTCLRASHRRPRARPKSRLQRVPGGPTVAPGLQGTRLPRPLPRAPMSEA